MSILLPIAPGERLTPIPAVPSASELDAIARLGPLPAAPTPTSVRRLAERSGLSVRQVRYWLAELPRRQAARRVPPPFVELRPTAVETPPLRVVLPCGLLVEVPSPFDPLHLRALVDALSC